MHLSLMRCIRQVGRKPVIIIVSSDEALVQALQAITPSITTQRATSVEAVRPYLMQAEPPTLLIVAASLPDFEAFIQLAREHMLPLIAVVDTLNQRVAAFEAGADDYLWYPFLEAEVNARLAAHGVGLFQRFDQLIETMSWMNQHFSPYSLDQGVQQIAQLFHATSAWMVTLNRHTHTIDTMGSYNLPLVFQNQPDILARETRRCLELIKAQAHLRFVKCEFSAQALAKNGLKHSLSIPLYGSQHLLGVLNLAYPQVPTIRAVERRALTMLGQNLGILLEMSKLQEEMQSQATQTGFMVLIAHLIGQQSDMAQILAVTLEQTLSLLQAGRGEIWLVSDDGAWLELTASLSESLHPPDKTYQPLYEGLLGIVVRHNEARHFDLPQPTIAVPLRHHDSLLGVLALYNTPPARFTNQDAVLLEGIASLTASAVANAQHLVELQDYAAQQRVLYEMSQQIAAGLDLQDTLDRVLQWVNRLINTDVTLLWLHDDTHPQQLNLVGAVGIDLPPSTVSLKVGESITGWVAAHGEASIVADPAHDSRLDLRICEALGILPYNILAVPITHQNHSIGAVSVVNKVGSTFDDDDLTLLQTAADMMGVSIRNAQLHTQALALMQEREYLSGQVLQSERLATVGRLTASLAHEVNNPMQAIQGALTLALEELNDPEALQTYLQLSLQEAGRVVTLIARMRQIYRPTTDQPRLLNINELLREVTTVARKEVKRQKVQLHLDLARELPLLFANPNQLHLVFLNLTLNLCQVIGTVRGGALHICSQLGTGQTIRVALATDSKALNLSAWNNALSPQLSETHSEMGFGLLMSRDIIRHYGGSITLRQEADMARCIIELPIGQSSA